MFWGLKIAAGKRVQVSTATGLYIVSACCGLKGKADLYISTADKEGSYLLAKLGGAEQTTSELEIFLEPETEVHFESRGDSDVYLTGESIPEAIDDLDMSEDSFSVDELQNLPRENPKPLEKAPGKASAAKPKANAVKPSAPKANEAKAAPKANAAKPKANEAKAANAKPKANEAKAAPKANAKPSAPKANAAKEEKPADSKKRNREETNGEKQESKKKALSQGSDQVQVKQGVQVLDISSGSGVVAKRGSKVTVKYVGSLDSGYVFDKGNISFKLGAGEVIKGWDIGVEGMKLHGERRLHIPANLGYGKQRAGEIPPNSNLNFVVKLTGCK
eukprot:TRINITY_DN264_c0_g1_i1.p1 TRINITY_DN264_c0_g1~~TRINITY_DN264_c0_g1_i1.p1  ORF type:complete len:332 (-),score=109.50 TRINITY_DN264_c0_g1_i1:50-1045(-)